jgi:hypothetical protein
MKVIHRATPNRTLFHVFFASVQITCCLVFFSVVYAPFRGGASISNSSIAIRTLPTCEGYSKVFCASLSRFDAEAIPDRRPPVNGIFALFLLVRQTSILDPLISESQEFFDKRYFDEVFIFNEENLSGPGIVSDLPVRYVDIKWLWSTYPPQFDPVAIESHWVVKDIKWGYHNMIRFFWRSLFLLPEIANVTAYMRLDGDSCIHPGPKSPRDVLSKAVVYVHNGEFVDQAFVCENLETFARDYVRYFEIQVRNRHAWDSAFMWGGVTGYYNNLELMDIKFWMRRDVQHFVQFVDASWGTYLWRWGDAPLRYIALAIFATPNMVRGRPSEWYYNHPCREN